MSTENETQQPAKDPFDSIVPERVWISISNIEAKPGRLCVALEVNGKTVRELFHGYPSQEDGVVSQNHNLTWLIRAAVLAERERCAKLVEKYSRTPFPRAAAAIRDGEHKPE